MEVEERPKSYVSRLGATALSIYLLLMGLLSAVVLLAVWPASDGPMIPTQLGKLSTEVRYLLLVVSSGVLGSSFNALSSYADSVGHRRLVKSWLLWYVMRVFVAVPLSMILYMVIRGILISPGANIADVNPFGLAAVSVLVGVFANSAANHLLRLSQTVPGQPTKLEKDIDRIGAILGITSLNNYQGYVCITFRSEAGVSLPTPDGGGLPVLKAGEKYRMAVWFQPGEPQEGLKEKIYITGGVDATDVEFVMRADSEKVSMRPRQASVSFAVAERSREVRFEFTAPGNSGPFDFWVQVIQKNQLIELVSKTAQVSSGERPKLQL